MSVLGIEAIRVLFAQEAELRLAELDRLLLRLEQDGSDETLIVVSSDLSHFHGYAEAQALDCATAEAILQLRNNLDHQQACGDKSRVVGYASFAFHEPDPSEHHDH